MHTTMSNQIPSDCQIPQLLSSSEIRPCVNLLTGPLGLLTPPHLYQHPFQTRFKGDGAMPTYILAFRLENRLLNVSLFLCVAIYNL